MGENWKKNKDSVTNPKLTTTVKTLCKYDDKQKQKQQTDLEIKKLADI